MIDNARLPSLKDKIMAQAEEKGVAKKSRSERVIKSRRVKKTSKK